MNTKLISLSLLSPGQTGTIHSFLPINSPLSIRYQEMGLQINTTIQFLRTAPLGCPLQIQTPYGLFSIRKSDANNILIQLPCN